MTLALVTLLLMGMFAFLILTARKSEQAGKAATTAKTQGETLERVQEAQEAEREIENMQRDAPDTALDRLRDSRWNRDK